MARDIAVVIPFFQREAGILRRAVESIAKQRDVDLRRVTALIVDDCSPQRPSADLDGHWEPLEVRLIKRPVNGGPGASRNTALDALGDEVHLVAFLDSDDQWNDDHLAVALRALASGTFFFANFFQLGAQQPAFERAGRIRISDHEHLFGDCYRFRGRMLDQIYIGNVIGTSTVVFRRDAHRALRFATGFRRAGEDYLMWSSFAANNAVFVFRSTPSVIYGKGVNVYAGVTYGTVAHLARTREEIAYLRHARLRFPLAEATQAHIARRLKHLRRLYWRSFARLLVHDPLALLRDRGSI
ncbi:MAG: glycosyltransferase family 2 protein [Sutterellaceae bacterium]|nr:glycosyltransferase [Burkholderiaceae bacterium]MDW8430305.1 glycosyltransferase family 2 protein [Sutterellaceae bacterium]